MCHILQQDGRKQYAEVTNRSPSLPVHRTAGRNKKPPSCRGAGWGVVNTPSVPSLLSSGTLLTPGGGPSAPRRGAGPTRSRQLTSTVVDQLEIGRDRLR